MLTIGSEILLKRIEATVFKDEARDMYQIKVSARDPETGAKYGFYVNFTEEYLLQNQVCEGGEYIQRRLLIKK